jgi:SMODS and SLOG-associating 2TM effector domain family 5
MGVTAGSRFNAARRLAALDRSYNLMLSLVSVAVIALTVVPYIYDLRSQDGRLIALFTVAASVAILVLTNLNAANRGLVIAEQLHRCALEISEIARDLDADISGERQIEIELFASRYGDALQKYAVNHDKVDYIEHKLHRRDEFENEYVGRPGDLKAAGQSLQVWFGYNYVWLFGLSALIVCGIILARAIDLAT